jgi:hypothetical protein
MNDDTTPESKDQPDEDQVELTEEQKKLQRKEQGSLDGLVAPADDDIIIKKVNEHSD